MIIDIATVLVGLAMAYFGWVTGAYFQFVRLIVFLASLVLAYFIGAEMAIFHLGASPGVSARAATTQWFIISFFILWAIGSFAASRLAGNARDASIERVLSDALSGAFLGFLRALFIAYILVIAMWSRYVETETGSFDLPYDESHVARVSVTRSLLERKIRAVSEYLEVHYTTDPEAPEERIKKIGDLPADERSVY